MAGADIGSLTASKHLKLVAVADVDLNRTAKVKHDFPGVKIYQDWRELLDKEKGLTSANISTPDHMHGSITMRAMQQGLHVYTQKPLTQTIYEARQLAKVAHDKKLVSQMGIQVHSDAVHRTVVATIQAGAIGKVKEVHSWSGKHWGDRGPRPIAWTRCRPASTGTSGWAWRPHGPLSATTTTTPATGASARFRHRHLRRHGLSHSRPGVHRSGPDGAEIGTLRGRSGRRTPGVSTRRYPTSFPAPNTPPTS